MPDLYVSSSSVAGRGVFAGRDFEVGETLEIAQVIFLSETERKILDKTQLFNYYFSWGEDQLSAAIGLGFASLYNHSYSPNARYLKNDQDNTLLFMALGIIRRGDEILVNYNCDPNDTSPVWFNAKR